MSAAPADASEPWFEVFTPELGPHALTLARELAKLDSRAEALDRDAHVLLFLLVMLAEARGGSCIPLGDLDAQRSLEQGQGVPEVSHLAALLVALGLSTRWLDRIAKILRAPSTTLFATTTPGGRLPSTPLVLELTEGPDSPDGREASALERLPEGAIYAHRLLFAERTLATLLAERLGRSTATAQSPASGTQGLTQEQQRAVEIASTAPLSVVTGGPGTGKTHVVRALVSRLVELGVAAEAIALTAPTGKAAQRMGESLAALDSQAGGTLPGLQAPRTLHRLLGASRDGSHFRHGSFLPLSAKIVIVDEASMIDLSLLSTLVSALPKDSSLVLLGDEEQLPSVDAGAVLREIVALGHPNVARLTQSFRMDPSDPEGREIYLAASDVRLGETQALRQLPFRTPAARRWQSESPVGGAVFARLRGEREVMFRGVERVALDELEALLMDWVVRLLDDSVRQVATRPAATSTGVLLDDVALDATAGKALAHLSNHRIFCATRLFPTGTEALNVLVAGLFADALNLPRSRDLLVPGSPVMVTRNLHEKGLWNGDFGVVVEAEDPTSSGPSGERRVRFASRKDGLSLVTVSELRGAVELAWASTVHKAQGSECARAVIVLPDREVPIARRELLYTALTRCRKAACLVGSTARLCSMIERKIERSSGLGARIQRILADAPG